MPNPSTATNPLDYPRYVRGLRPAFAESLGPYVEDELEKLQNSMENMASAADSNSSAKVSVETVARTTADEALAAIITELDTSFTTDLGTANARIDDEIVARSSADGALTDRLDTAESTFTTGLASANGRIDTEVLARGDADDALQTALDLLDAGVTADITAANARITTEETTRADADSALASRTSTLEANYVTLSTDVADNTADITAANAAISTEATARADADSAMATDITSLTSSYTTIAADVAANTTDITTNASAITSEATTRASADSAMASNITSLTSSYTTLAGTVNLRARTFRQGTAPTADNTGDLWIDTSDNNKVKRWDGSTWVDASDVRITTNSAAITSEATTRADADSALASDISTLSTTVAGHTSTLTTYGTSISGLQAKYGVTLDVDGYVSGFALNNGGGTSDFIISADHFAVVKPSTGAAPVVIFDVTADHVRFNGKLLADDLLDGLLDATIHVGDGKIIFDNGSVMKVQGLGFGSSNQFIEWFGPHFAALTSCTEANAISYLKTNGDAYFGGSLTAGTLRNATTGTGILSNASATLGPFGSNGGSRVVVLSYYFEANASITTSCPTPDPPYGTIDLYKGTDATGTHLTTLTMGPGSYECTGGIVGDPGFINATLSGSTTVTDTSGGTGPINYYAVLSRTGFAGGTVQQSITIISTEA
jgi:hypothetical protein